MTDAQVLEADQTLMESVIGDDPDRLYQYQLGGMSLFLQLKMWGVAEELPNGFFQLTELQGARLRQVAWITKNLQTVADYRVSGR